MLRVRFSPSAWYRQKKLSGQKKSRGEVPEWPKGADCKSAGLCLRRFESSPLHQYDRGLDVGRAGIAQLVEREPSKLGVAGSSPVSRSTSSAFRMRVARIVWAGDEH